MDWKVPRIAEDANCRCGYNLRGLSFDHACPECGRDVFDSTRFAIVLPTGRTREKRDQYTRVHQMLGDAADASGFSTQACWLVKCAVTYAGMQCGDCATPITAGELCRALREYARLHSGGLPAARLGLMAVNISSSEDVGEIVYALVGAGLLHESPTDSKDDFKGLFTLDNFQTVRLS